MASGESRRAAAYRSLARLGMFKSLHSRDYRWFWLGRLAASATMQMSSVAQGWLVYALTGSGFALGWVGAFGSVSTLLVSPFAGVLSDRIERRHILTATRAGMVVNVSLVTLLIVLGRIQLWHLAASGLVGGALMAFMMPAQNALMADIVDRSTLLNAVSLTAVGMGFMGIFGASGAGLMIDELGVWSVYGLMVFLYVVALYTVIQLPLTGVVKGAQRSILTDIKTGITYILHEPRLLGVILLSLARVLLAMPYGILLPQYADEMMGLGARGLGMLASASGIGNLIAALAVAALGDFRHKGKLLLGSGIAIGAGLLVLSVVRSLPVAFTMLVLIGMGNNAAMVANQTLVQVNCEDVYRGRVMSTYMMLWGLTPLGTLPAGALADRFGVTTVFAGQGILLLVIFLVVWWRMAPMRSLE
ncbi:MAG: MFS transporter [Anaerolineae bacterium]|jgi:MFS family permease|nr:MFS transporter [Chloroflexota bacterium]